VATNVHLTKELEAFARDCVASGRYNNVSEVLRDALRMLREAENRRARFNAMLDDVRQETTRDGTVELDSVLGEMDALIDGHER
jgi:antitoxin ParD1/3/4